jgi:hypothetical protein
VSDDRGAIEGLLADYGDHIDDGDFDSVGQLFAEGVICDAEGTHLAAGAAAVTGLYESTTRRYPDGTPRTHHVTSNVAIAIAGDSAQCRSRFTVFQGVHGGELRPVITGRYRDRFVRADGRWRFAERRMDPRLTGDLSAHLLIDLPPATNDE